MRSGFIVSLFAATLDLVDQRLQVLIALKKLRYKKCDKNKK